MSRIRNALALFLFGLAARLADGNDDRLKITRVYTPAVEPEKRYPGVARSHMDCYTTKDSGDPFYGCVYNDRNCPAVPVTWENS